MGNKKLVATVAGACTLGLVVGVGTMALVDTAGAAYPKATYDVVLNGAQQVPPVATAGTSEGNVKVKGKTSKVCVKFKNVSPSVLPATMAHIHVGTAGNNGIVVVPLVKPTAKKAGKAGKSKTCATVNATLASNLINNPANYYLNIHNGAFPNGVIRAQLG